MENVSKTIPHWANLRVMSHFELQQTLDAGTYVVHPVKRLGPSIDLIRKLHAEWLGNASALKNPRKASAIKSIR
jgi:hypothetical protein